MNTKKLLVLPSYLCKSVSFTAFIADLKKLGFKRFILTHDLDLDLQTVAFHRTEIRALRKMLSDISRTHGVRFIVVTNLLLRDRPYTRFELASVGERNPEAFYMTLPLCGDPQVVLNNVFAVKSLGYAPIICGFDKVSVFYSDKFCNALLTTENFTFMFDCDVLNRPKNDSSIRKALHWDNDILFFASHFTSSQFVHNLSDYLRLLPRRYRIPLETSSERLIDKFF